MDFKNKKIIIILVLTLVLGASIFVSVYFLFLKEKAVLQNSLVGSGRVIFKEDGVTEDELFLLPKRAFALDPSVLEKLRILNDDVSLLDGLTLDLGGRQNIPLAVVIENHPDARLQTEGLEKAKIVYEALAEGGITRYLAVFDPIGVAKIGPVRSARPYFIHWAEEFGGLFVHIGGSDEALAYLKNSSKVLNVDENRGEQVIWRDQDYQRPHNAFTSTNDLYRKVMPLNWQKQITDSFFKFKLKEYPALIPVQQINLDFSFPSYKVFWEYNPLKNNYIRHLGGKKQESLTAKNIIVQVALTQLIEEDEKGRLDISVLGQGKAYYFLDGEALEGTWFKKDFGEKTVFYDAENQEMQFNKGVTWVEVIDSVSRLSY